MALTIRPEMRASAEEEATANVVVVFALGALLDRGLSVLGMMMTDAVLMRDLSQ